MIGVSSFALPLSAEYKAALAQLGSVASSVHTSVHTVDRLSISKIWAELNVAPKRFTNSFHSFIDAFPSIVEWLCCADNSRITEFFQERTLKKKEACAWGLQDCRV